MIVYAEEAMPPITPWSHNFGLQVHPAGGKERHHTLGQRLGERRPCQLRVTHVFGAGMSVHDPSHPGVKLLPFGVRQDLLSPFALHDIRPLLCDGSRAPTSASAGMARLAVRQSLVHFLGRDRQVPNAHADGVLHRVGDGRCDRAYGVLPDAPGVVRARAAVGR
jgi:hypothetical protein